MWSTKADVEEPKQPVQNRTINTSVVTWVADSVPGFPVWHQGTKSQMGTNPKNPSQGIEEAAEGGKH